MGQFWFIWFLFSPDMHQLRAMASGLQQCGTIAKPFTVTINKCFQNVIKLCATVNREETWINKIIEKKFVELHKMGYVHSIESWYEKKLVGGIYGVSLGSCFFAESMFSKRSNASKFALINLVSRLNLLGYNLLDVQFVNPHLKQFGVYELSRGYFKKLLNIIIFLSQIKFFFTIKNYKTSKTNQ